MSNRDERRGVVPFIIGFAGVAIAVTIVVFYLNFYSKNDNVSAQITSDTEEPKPRIVGNINLQGSSCEEKRTDLLIQPNPANCIDVFYASARAIDADVLAAYGGSFGSKLSFGEASVAVPIIKDREVSNRVFLDRYARSLAALGQLRVDDLTLVDQREAINYELRTRKNAEQCKENPNASKNCQLSYWIGTGRITAISNANHNDEIEYFVSRVNNELEKYNGRILLYIHGFDTGFDESLMSVAHLYSDLNVQDNAFIFQGKESQREEQAGLPIVFSWPTELTINGSSNLEKLEPYLLSQLRANYAAKYLSNLMEILFDKTVATEIRVVAHSMGNRVVASALPKTASHYGDGNSSKPKLKFVLAAADIGNQELESFLLEAKNNATNSATQWSPEFTIYTSSTDKALYGSNWSQLAKGTVLQTDALLSLAGSSEEEIEEVRKAFAEIGIEFQDYFNESFCRVGKYYAGLGTEQKRSGRLSVVGLCKPFTWEHGKADTVSATDFVTDSFGHGYAENSPMILADMSCALNNITVDSGDRMLRGVDFKDIPLPFFRKRRFWILDADKKSFPKCRSTDREYLFEISHNDVQKSKKSEFLSLYFDLKLPLPIDLSLPLAVGIELEEFVQQFMQSHPHAEVTSIIVRAHTDTSGTNEYNVDLGDRRGRLVAFKLEELGFLRGIISIENFDESSPVIDTGDGVREARNRRVEIQFNFVEPVFSQ